MMQMQDVGIIWKVKLSDSPDDFKHYQLLHTITATSLFFVFLFI